MAIPRDVQNFINSITDPRSRTQAEQTYNQLITGGTSLQRSFDAIKAAFGAMTSSARQFRDELDNSLDLAKAIVSALSKQEGPINRAKKAMSGLVSIGQQLVEEERELDAIDERRLKRMAKEAATKLSNFQIEARNISGRLTIDDKIAQNQLRLARIASLSTQQQTASARALKNKLEDELEVLNAYKQQDISYKAITLAAEKRYKLEQATTKTFGLTGAALAGMSTVASKLGLGHLGEQIDEIDKKLREEMRVEIEKNGGHALGLGKRFEYAARGVGSMIKLIAKGFLDPLVIMGKIFDAFLDVNKAAVDYTRLSGINATNQAALNDRLATSVDYLQTAAELTNQLGMSATSVFSNDTIAGIAEAKNLLGLSAEQAGSLGIRSKLANQNIDSFQDNLLKGVSAGNQLNKSLVAPGVAMRDILDSSEDITMSLGNNPTTLGKAAVAARAFGMSLQQVSDIAEGLLNFEDSISAELEAELMTGRYLNLERARELALTNDLEGLSKELAKNGATAAEFSKMNRLEQDALAKALGMNREQLAKSILAQEASKNATLEQRAAVMGVTKEQMQSMDIQERISKSLDKLAQAFAPILEGLVPIAELLVSILQPVAMVVGYLSTGLAPFVKYLTIGYGLLKGVQLTLQGSLAISQAMSLLKARDAGYEAAILTTLGLQNAARAFSLTQAMTGNTLTAIYAALNQTVLGSIIAQGAGLIKNIGIMALQLAQQLGIMSAAMATNAAMTFGIGVAVAVAAALAGIAAIKAVTADDMVSQGYGKRTILSPEGAIRLNDNDTVVAGTNLFEPKQQSIANKVGTNSGGGQSTMSAAVRQSNSANEIRQMREENKQLLTALLNKSSDVYMDSNKVGKSLVLGSQKSS